jgi:hypothetical protein
VGGKLTSKNVQLKNTDRPLIIIANMRQSCRRVELNYFEDRNVFRADWRDRAVSSSAVLDKLHNKLETESIWDPYVSQNIYA